MSDDKNYKAIDNDQGHPESESAMGRAQNSERADPDPETAEVSDRKMQQRVSHATIAMAILTACLVVVNAIYVYFQWKQTKISSQALIAAQRPWVSVKPRIGGGLQFNDEGGRITIVFHLKILGQSPAINTYVEGAFYVLGPKTNILAEQKKVCFVRRPLAPGTPSVGDTLFPGEEVEASISLPIGREEIERFRADMAELHKDLKTAQLGISPVLVGCVSYRLAFDGSVHTSAFAADLSRIDPNHPRARMTIDPSAGDVPAELLRLSIIDWAGTSTAD